MSHFFFFPYFDGYSDSANRDIETIFFLLQALYSRFQTGRKHNLYLLYAKLLAWRMKSYFTKQMFIVDGYTFDRVSLGGCQWGFELTLQRLLKAEIAASRPTAWEKSWYSWTRWHNDPMELRFWVLFFQVWDDNAGYPTQQVLEEDGIQKGGFEAVVAQVALMERRRALLAVLLARMIKKNGLEFTKDRNILYAQLTALCYTHYGIRTKPRDTFPNHRNKERGIFLIKSIVAVCLDDLTSGRNDLSVDPDDKMHPKIKWMVVEAIQRGVMDELGWESSLNVALGHRQT